MSSLTRLEERAKEALVFSPFPLNLDEIRSQVALLLREVQRFGFFDEYTSHGFDHVEGMLRTAQWLIPPETLEKLTPATCLFITLAIYFHDIGLLISKAEFEKREKNLEYKRYLEELNTDTASNQDYIAKIDQLEFSDREKLLYSEFVRSTHGARVRAWVEGAMLDDNEASAEIRKIIQSLIGKLEPLARRDLALVCESHTKDDISDTNKYKISRPYGDSIETEANLQYAAVILRVVDLLQITNHRAPSVSFKLISPTDPISQLEWQKQRAVRSVRAAQPRNREGQAADDILPHKIEVHARFERPDGFFGLTSYIAYAQEQLTLCQDALKKSEIELVNPPLFPWKYIDDGNVEADGFLTEAFGFELDQQKILDLLTGHTLYNNSDVVIRELTQNALDAVRLQSKINSKPSETDGSIKINWDSQERTLEIIDNGTGMSQSVIENHLLKVGSSRYQDPKFKETHPEFSSISRFGIGVLSAFMVADSVQITTCALEDEEARQISLRSVHGKYLIRLLNKISDRDEIGVYPHGSSVKLKLRSSANIGDVIRIARAWLLFPRCNVEVKIDSEAPVKIGYSSPKEALQDYIKQPEFLASRGKFEFEIKEDSVEGVKIAYVVERDDLYNDWSFVAVTPGHRYGVEHLLGIGAATAIEGVGVEFTTPGFRANPFLAIANLTGLNAPKTNVARSAIEDTNEYRENLRIIYKLFSRHITAEIGRLSKTDEYSLSRAVEQAPYIAAPLVSALTESSRPGYLESELARIPFILMEENTIRRSVSVEEMTEIPTFWTVNSQLTSSVEFFVREAHGDISASKMLKFLPDSGAPLPEGITMCNFGKNKYSEDKIRESFEPSLIEADQRARRLTLKWSKIGATPKWVRSTDLFEQLHNIDRSLWSTLAERHNYGRHDRDFTSIFVPIGSIEITGLDEFGEFVSNKHTYMHPDDSLSKFLKEEWLSGKTTSHQACCAYLYVLESIRGERINRSNLTVEWLEKVLGNSGLEKLQNYMDLNGFMAAYKEGNPRRFNPYAWTRRGSNEYEGE